MIKRVYIETSIPSFYYEIRQEATMVSQREWTRDWWDNHRSDYELVTSTAVIDELEAGMYSSKNLALELISKLPLVPIVDSIEEIVATYTSHFVMPKNPKGDALHLALASYFHCQFLLTWNCKNLANANKFEHIRYVNNLLGLYTPTLTTPLGLLYEEEQENEK
jgi:hypothetical protein